MLIISIISLIVGICFEILPTVITLENAKAIKEIIPYLNFETLKNLGFILILAGGSAILGKIFKK